MAEEYVVIWCRMVVINVDNGVVERRPEDAGAMLKKGRLRPAEW